MAIDASEDVKITHVNPIVSKMLIVLTSTLQAFCYPLAAVIGVQLNLHRESADLFMKYRCHISNTTSDHTS